MAGLNFDSVFITGGNRGIGLEFVKQFLKLKQKPLVFATYRDESSSKDLLELARSNPNLTTIKCDVTKYDKLADMAKVVAGKVGDAGLNVLINNSGILERESIETLSVDTMLRSYHVNTIGPLMVTQHLLPLIKMAAASKQGAPSVSRAAVINITSKMGSISDNSSGGFYPYRCSKSALNMATRSLAADLKPAGVVTCVLHPGWVQTDLGGGRAIHTLQQSVEGMMAVMAKVDEGSSGLMYEFKGNLLAW